MSITSILYGVCILFVMFILLPAFAFVTMKLGTAGYLAGKKSFEELQEKDKKNGT